MIHTPILPVIIPLIPGFSLLLIKRFGLKTQEIFSLISVFIIILVSIFAFTKTLSMLPIQPLWASFIELIV